MLGKFRLVFLGNPDDVKVRIVGKLDFAEIEKSLQDENILGIVISKEE